MIKFISHWERKGNSPATKTEMEKDVTSTSPAALCFPVMLSPCLCAGFFVSARSGLPGGSESGANQLVCVQAGRRWEGGVQGLEQQEKELPWPFSTGIPVLS